MGCTSTFHKKVSKEKSGYRYFMKIPKIKRDNKEKIELYFSCIKANQYLSNLKIVLSYSLYPNLNYQGIGETEELQSGSENFITFFLIDYSFETNQYLRISLIENNILIETLTTTVGYIIGSRSNTVDFKVNKMDANFALRVNARKVITNNSNSVPNLSFAANVTNPHTITGEYYILVLNNHTKPPKWKKVFKTNEGTGPSFRLDMDQVGFNDICLSNPDRKFKVELRKLGAGILGECEVSLNSLRSQSILNIGTFKVDLRYEFRPNLNFLTYLERGLQISLMTAIDYTASNEVYTNPKSLHYIYGESPNEYEQVIRQCGSILSCYDYDQKFPVYGFGGKINNTKDPSHFFNVNFSDKADVYGVEGIINCYKSSLSRIALSGPTNFAPLIKGVVKEIKEKFINEGKSTNTYNVLLILTDSLILDMYETKQAICKAAKHPISIIIVGVGSSEDLANMEELDGDGLKTFKNKKGKKISRDIVQFVNFEKFKNNPDKFAQELLCEIPYQIEEYFHIYNTFFRKHR